MKNTERGAGISVLSFFLYSSSMNVVVLVAGTNEPSNSNALADAFIQGMQQINHPEEPSPVTAHISKLQIGRAHV